MRVCPIVDGTYLTAIAALCNRSQLQQRNDAILRVFIRISYSTVGELLIIIRPLNHFASVFKYAIYVNNAD